MRTFGGGRWIGHGGPVFWPPRLPGITSLDYFSVEVCEIISVDDIASLRARIFEANPSVVKGMLTCNWAEWTVTLMLSGLLGFLLL